MCAHLNHINPLDAVLTGLFTSADYVSASLISHLSLRTLLYNTLVCHYSLTG